MMPLYLFCMVQFIWNFTLLEFEVGGYDKMEKFLKTVSNLTNLITLMLSNDFEVQAKGW